MQNYTNIIVCLKYKNDKKIKSNKNKLHITKNEK